MFQIVFGIFLALHGLVHLLYAAHSQRMLELQPDMPWPDTSWMFSGLLGQRATRGLATGCCVLAGAGFLVGGAAFLLRQTWWRWAVLASAALSTAMVAAFWDGRLRGLDDQGLVALLLNAAILVLLLIARWPS